MDIVLLGIVVRFVMGHLISSGKGCLTGIMHKQNFLETCTHFS